MSGIHRLLGYELKRAAAAFPAVVLTGPRRAGKTTLLRQTFPTAQWVLLEDPDVLARIGVDPRGFIDTLRPPVILDEIQNAPELFAWVRTRIDRDPEARGRWLLTGSQDFAVMSGVSESMAGRAAILQLLPLGVEESPEVTLFRGGYPEVVLAPDAADLWFRSYVQTYIERDVRALVQVSNLGLFRRFMGLLATRTGQVLNKTQIAAPLGVSVPTVTAWLGVLEATGTIALLQPWFTNLGKRMIKSPRLVFLDTGLACHLLGLTTADAVERSPLLGPLFESFVASELVKHRTHAGQRPNVHWFRDEQGLEVDFVLEGPGLEPVLVEAKAHHTPVPDDARAIRSLRKAAPGNGTDYVVHRGAASSLAPAVEAVDVATLHARLRERGL